MQLPSTATSSYFSNRVVLGLGFALFAHKFSCKEKAVRQKFKATALMTSSFPCVHKIGRFLTILQAILEQTKWAKGSIPRSIASMMYAEHVLRVNVDWSTFCTEGFGAIGQGLLAKRPVHIPYVLVPKWFRNDPKLYMDPQAQEGTAWAVGGSQRADGGRGRADDGLALPEWESFAGLVAPVAEGVQTAVDAKMEALHQQHDIDV